jgi:hypothetical protein
MRVIAIAAATSSRSSPGTALLNTLFASAIASYAATHGSDAASQASAAISGYSTAFGWATAIFVLGSRARRLAPRGGGPLARSGKSGSPSRTNQPFRVPYDSLTPT